MDKTEITTLTDLWNSPEWKKVSREFTEGKVCEWCGRKAGDTYITKKGDVRRVGLAPHHIEKHKWGLPLYNQVKNRLFSDWWKQHKLDHGYDVPRSLAVKEVRSYVKGMWVIDNLDLIQTEFAAAKREILDAYINLDPEHVIILCTRCHYARGKGLLICPVCKENYRKKSYPTCYSCSRKLKTEQEE